MEDEETVRASGGQDALAGAARTLESAEEADDDARLAALDSLHARLADELDKPATDPSAG